jgi:branched-chain amino acid transport system ATP-binding protein
MLEAKELMVFYENMLALNNVSITAEAGSVIGVFGSNSAGKSTLMYTLAGIMLDIKKKESMRGGERITLFGALTFEGRDISTLPAHARAKLGIVLCPERRRIFPESSVLENLKIGSYLTSIRERKKKFGICAGRLPAAPRVPEQAGRFPERRRTANAGHRPGADGQSEGVASR